MNTNYKMRMRLTVKRFLQAGLIVSFTVYMTVYMLRNYIEGSVVDEQITLAIDGQPIAAERLPRALLTNNKVDNGLARPNDLPVVTEVIVKQENRTELKESEPQRQLDQVFISVKTTKNFHKSRLDVILRTWFVLAREQTYFFTDAEDEEFQEKTNGHLINTNCSSSHSRKALCCKMSVEFDTFLESNKKWFCHFDDDNYVNVPQLVRLLEKYTPTENWYLGKPSIRVPLEILDRDSMKKISFWFATGGAGFCLSRALVLKMMPIASDGKFISIGEKIRLPDDVTMGYIIEHLLKLQLTVVDQFHSHLEPMKFIKQETFPDQITFSYSRYGKETNTLTIDGGFDSRFDPTRFLSLHCFLFPNFSFCPR